MDSSAPASSKVGCSRSGQMGSQIRDRSNGGVGCLGEGYRGWCSQKQLSHAGKERLHLAPCKRGVGTSCLGVTDGVFASLNNQTRRGQDTFFYSSSWSVDSVCTVSSQLHCTLREGRNKLSTSLALHSEDT